jgi:DNA-binding winged helix-turn-helix (wHTH) protein
MKSIGIITIGIVCVVLVGLAFAAGSGASGWHRTWEEKMEHLKLKLTDKLNLNEAQIATLDRITEEIIAEHQELSGKREVFKEDFLALLEKESVRPEELKALFDTKKIDPKKRNVTIDGAPILLTTNEFTALWLLCRHPGEVLDRDRILIELRGIDSDAFNRSVDITMSRLRQKLGDDPKSPSYIKTVWGTGYMFIGNSDPEDTPHDA